MPITLFPARVPIGRVVDSTGKERDVLMTPEFSRALADVLARIGGPSGLGSDDLAVLDSFGALPPDAAGLAAAAVQNMPLDLGAQVASLRAEIEALRVEINAVQAYATLAQRIEELSIQLGMIEDPGAAVRYAAKIAAQPANTVPLIDGVAAVGTSVLYARQDHVHPTDTSRQATIIKGTATGSRAGNAALASLLTALATSGLVTDSTTV